jgi:hypothetical protein
MLENKKRFAYNGWACDKCEGEGTFVQNTSGKILRKAEQLEYQDVDDTMLLHQALKFFC